MVKYFTTQKYKSTVLVNTPILKEIPFIECYDFEMIWFWILLNVMILKIFWIILNDMILNFIEWVIIDFLRVMKMKNDIILNYIKWYNS